MLHSLTSKQIRLFTICLLLAITFASGLFVVTHKSFVSVTLQTLEAHITWPAENEYPEVASANLSPVQKKIITITKNEYQKRPVSFDKSVLAYTQGNKEPWCADYATWVLKQAGAPLANPNSGSWRIPGVLTLQNYYKSSGKYQMAGRYQPKTGDLAFYIGNKTLDGRSKQHVNIVLNVEGNTMTTIGGNELGRMRINTQNYKKGANNLVGFGIL